MSDPAASPAPSAAALALDAGRAPARDGEWRARVATPEQVLARLHPGGSVFLSTGPAEPRRLVRALVTAEAGNLRDLEILHVASLGDALRTDPGEHPRYRLRTFFSGYLAEAAVAEGRVDLIPAHVAAIPALILSGAVRVDAAFVQVSPPDASGYVSLGVAVDAAHAAIERAQLVVAEVNARVPRTLGDTLLHVSAFDCFVESDEPLIHFDRWTVDERMDRVARNVASLVDDGACLAYSLGPLFEALTPHLTGKRDLGVHTVFATDALRDLIESGAVTNRRKATHRGRSIASWVIGTEALARWMDRNPLLELVGLDTTADPLEIGRNDGVFGLVQARKVDLTGRVALHRGKGLLGAGPGEAVELMTGARFSRGGRSVVALPSRNREDRPNILPTVEGLPNVLPNRQAIDLVVTEYGVASLTGRTIRERAQALIDVAHPDDRAALLADAKAANFVYADQLFVPEAGRLYPEDVATMQTFAGGLVVRFRGIRPSDEEGMRRLFYRFSERSVYYRYFSPIKVMPHTKMQEYVNVDPRTTISIVGLVGDGGAEHIVAEGRYARIAGSDLADLAFVVDEAYQRRGISTFLFQHLIRAAKARGLRGFSATVLASNKAVLKVLETSPHPIRARVESGLYEMVIPFDEQAVPGRPRISFGG